MDDDLGSQLSAVGALADPGRRALYDYVTRQREPVIRDQVAAAMALPRHIAKFHLDRPVEAGLLDTEFRRLSGRRGPGAGLAVQLDRPRCLGGGAQVAPEGRQQVLEADRPVGRSSGE